MKMFCKDLKDQAMKIINYEKKERNDNDNNKDKNKVKTITYRLKFIDSYRFMQDSISNLVDNLSEINNKKPENNFVDTMRSMTDSLSQSIDKISEIDRKILQKNKFVDNMRSMMTSLSQSIDKISEIDRKVSQIDKKELDNEFIGNMRFMISSLSQSIDKVSEIDNKISQIDKEEQENKFVHNMRSMVSSLLQSINKVSEIDNKISHAKLIKKFFNTYQLCNKDLNKFALLLRKGVYPYEYMDSWNKFNEPVPLVEDHYYSKLNQKGITKEDLKHVKKVCDTFKIKNLGEYHDLYVQSDTALLADVFENFRDKCIEIYGLDPAHFLSAPGLAWQACLKKIQVELELLTDNDMLLMFEEGIRGGMCQATHRYANANNKYMKNHDKNKESTYLEYLDANNLYEWAMSKKLPVGNFKWVEKDDISIFDEEFITNYDKNSGKGYILEVDVKYPKDLHKLHSDLPFLPERMKINNCTKLVCSVHNKENYPIHILALK